MAKEGNKLAVHREVHVRLHDTQMTQISIQGIWHYLPVGLVTQ